MKEIKWDRAKAMSGWIIAAVLALTMAGMTLATNPTFNTVIQPGSQVEGCTVVVFTDGSSFFYRDGQTGAVTNTVSATLAIQNGINAMSNGGMECIQPGTYTVGNILVPSNTKIIGSPGVILNGASFNISGGVSNIEIRGLTVQSSPSTPFYISTWLTSQVNENIVIRDNVVSSSGCHAVEVIGYTLSTPRGYSMNITIADNIINRAGSSGYCVGILIENAQSKTNYSLVSITGNQLSMSWESGIHIEKAHGHVLVSENTVSYSGQKPTPTYGAGILVSGSTDVTITENVIYGSTKYGVEIAGVQSGQAYSSSVVVKDNQILRNTRGIVLSPNLCSPASTCSSGVIIGGNDVSYSTYAGLIIDSDHFTPGFWNQLMIQGNRFIDNNPGQVADPSSGFWDGCGVYILVNTQLGFSGTQVSIEENLVGFTASTFSNGPMCLGGNYRSMTVLNNMEQNITGIGVRAIQVLSGNPILLARSNALYNPKGKITNPFGTSTVGLGGASAAPSSGTVYTVISLDLFITSQNGTVSNITVRDPSGTVIAWGMTTTNALFLSVGYQIIWTYAVVPGVYVSGN